MDWLKIFKVLFAIITLITFIIVTHKHHTEEGFSWGFWAILLWISLCTM